MKTVFLGASAAACLVVTSFAGHAQQTQSSGGLLDAPYTTSTGETVPNPGKSQSGGTTPLDRKIQRENNRIDNSICKGC